MPSPRQPVPLSAPLPPRRYEAGRQQPSIGGIAVKHRIAVVTLSGLLLLAAGSRAESRLTKREPTDPGDQSPLRASPTTALDIERGAELTVTDVGAIGWADPLSGSELGIGFRLPGALRALYHAGIVLGDSSARVSDAAYGSVEGTGVSSFNFVPLEPVSWNTEGVVDSVTCALFDDGDADGTPLGVEVLQAVWSYPDAPYAIVDLHIEATSAVGGLQVGLFSDWDIGDYTANEIGSGVFSGLEGQMTPFIFAEEARRRGAALRNCGPEPPQLPSPVRAQPLARVPRGARGRSAGVPLLGGPGIGWDPESRSRRVEQPAVVDRGNGPGGHRLRPLHGLPLLGQLPRRYGRAGPFRRNSA